MISALDPTQSWGLVILAVVAAFLVGWVAAVILVPCEDDDGEDDEEDPWPAP